MILMKMWGDWFLARHGDGACGSRHEAEERVGSEKWGTSRERRPQVQVRSVLGRKKRGTARRRCRGESRPPWVSIRRGPPAGASVTRSEIVGEEAAGGRVNSRSAVVNHF